MRFGLAVFALALAVTACRAREPRQHGAVALPPVPTHTARFGSADPHDWNGRVPTTYAVHGIDAARWQGEIDWPPQSPMAFPLPSSFKATEGGDVIDPAFESYWWAQAAPDRRAGPIITSNSTTRRGNRLAGLSETCRAVRAGFGGTLKDQPEDPRAVVSDQVKSQTRFP